MKANQKFIRDADDGASVIVGAVLLFALSFLVLVMIQTNFVPVWEQNAEASHQQTVRSQMALLKSQMERQTQDVLTTPLSAPIDLERQGASSIFGSQNLPRGTMSISEPDSMEFNFTSPEINIATVTDPDFVGAGETWDLVDGDIIEDVSRIASLRVRFGTDAQPYKGEWAYLDATDGNGDHVGRLSINLLAMASNGNGVNKAEFWIDTEDAGGNQIGAQYFEANNQQVPAGSEPPYAWVNALNPDYRFDRLIGSAETPITLELTTTGGMPADFAAAYYQQTVGGGDILVGGGSQIFTDYEDVTTGGRITYESLSQHFVQQDLVLEYGALLLTQGDAATVTSAPAFAVGTASNRVSFSWTIPFPISSHGQTTTGSNGIVTTTAFDHRVMTASGQSVTIELVTDHPDAWINFWRNNFEIAGLTEGDEYTIDSDADSASFTIEGPLDDDSHDVTIALQTAQVEVIL